MLATQHSCETSVHRAGVMRQGQGGKEPRVGCGVPQAPYRGIRCPNGDTRQTARAYLHVCSPYKWNLPEGAVGAQ